MTRPHRAGAAEDRWNQWVDGRLRARGWQHLVVPYVGYAGPDFVRVLARLVLAPLTAAERTRGEQWREAQQYRRGWRNFFTAEVPDTEVTVTVGGVAHTVRTDRSGNVDARLPNPGLPLGWCDVTLEASGTDPTVARVFVVAADEDFGLVSDIDDTVIRTRLPRPLIAAYNTFVLQEHARKPVRGMASLYDSLLRDRPGAPTVYVSTGAWNTFGTLTRFLSRHALPARPAAAHRLGPDQHRLVPQRPGAQARLPGVAGRRLPRHPLGARRRRRTARPGAVRGVRTSPPRPGPRGRDPGADPHPAGARQRHPRGARRRSRRRARGHPGGPRRGRGRAGPGARSAPSLT